MSAPITLPFNKDFMTARELRAAADALEVILDQFDKFSNPSAGPSTVAWTPDQAEDFMSRVLMLRKGFVTARQMGGAA